MKAWEEVSREQLFQTRGRVSGIPVSETIETMIHYKVPFSENVAFNKGEDFVSLDDKTGPDLIPRKIHQVWIGG